MISSGCYSKIMRQFRCRANLVRSRSVLLLVFSVVLAAFILWACRTPTPVVPVPDQDSGLADAGPLPSPIADSGAVRFRGTSLNGGEFGAALPGEYAVDYQYPDPTDFDYFHDVGMNHVRLTFRHERLQRILGQPLDANEWAEIAYRITYANKLGMAITLAPMNSFRYLSAPLTTAQLADFWGRVASQPEVKGNALVSLSATNEPNGMTTEMVVALDNAFVAAVRKAGFTGLLLAPGNAFTGGGHWYDTYYGTPNANIMDQVGQGDPGVVFEVHQYLDANADGKGAECISPSVGVERLTKFVEWCRLRNRKAWLGEIAGKNTPTCQVAVTNTLRFVEASGVFAGWNWFGAGVWSFATTYPFSIGPSDPPKPQLAWLQAFLLTPTSTALKRKGKP